jgi:hypothetical protein
MQQVNAFLLFGFLEFAACTLIAHDACMEEVSKLYIHEDSNQKMEPKMTCYQQEASVWGT